MLHFADLHLHSKYSRAVSEKMDLEHLAEGAKYKGLSMLGTGDFTHPKWFAELKAKLNDDGNGLYSFHGAKFMLTVEVATFKSTPKGVKKVHHVIHAPGLESAEQLNDVLSRRGSLAADGRPMFGSMSPAELVELVRRVDEKMFVVPAHAWTPWFGVFGSMSGYDSMEEAYGDQAKHIIALETGMSSDPQMNWRLSKLDKYALVSNSDSHSPYPWRLGRECNCFDFDEISFDAIYSAIKNKDSRHFKFTVETAPAYGKYHYDGHRACNFSASPAETKKLNGICPVCKKPLVIGVEYRVEQLADRPDGFVPQGAIPFKTLLPMHELLVLSLGLPMTSKTVHAQADKLVAAFGSEFAVLLDSPKEQLLKHADEQTVDLILRNREGKIEVKPGFDGEYGVPLVGAKKQKSLGDF